MMDMSVPITKLPAVMLFVKKDNGNTMTLLGVMTYSGILSSSLLDHFIDRLSPDIFVSALRSICLRRMEQIRRAEYEQQQREEERNLAAQQRREYEEAVEADRRMVGD